MPREASARDTWRSPPLEQAEFSPLIVASLSRGNNSHIRALIEAAGKAWA